MHDDARLHKSPELKALLVIDPSPAWQCCYKLPGHQ